VTGSHRAATISSKRWRRSEVSLIAASSFRKPSLTAPSRPVHLAFDYCAISGANVER
jgi:hypothetical protein